MIARVHRLSKEADLRHLFHVGRRYKSAVLSLVVCQNRKEVTRISVIVATTVTKRATKRNTLRRRLMERFRILLPTIARGYDCAVIVHPAGLTAQRGELLRAFESALIRAGLRRPKNL